MRERAPDELVKSPAMNPAATNGALTARSRVRVEFPPFTGVDTNRTIAVPLKANALSKRPITSPVWAMLTAGHGSCAGVDASKVNVFIGVLLDTGVGVKRTMVVFMSNASSA